ncbi:MAG: GGDEF domain-containing protein, partial [Algicola sp.]|nr:GGDEF domain-containing protein [Algicola sp.]
MVLFYCFNTLAEGTATRFEHLSIEEGLSQVAGNSIIEDRHGFLWIATQDGLNRYDGYDFKVFRHDRQNPKSIATNYIDSLLLDSKGRIWIGTNGRGLELFDPVTEIFSHFPHDPKNPNSLSHNNIKSLAEDCHGNIWIGTYKGGLNRVNPKTMEISRFKRSIDDSTTLSHDKVWSMLVDSQCHLWLGTGGGLNLLKQHQLSSDKPRFIRYMHQPNNPNSISHQRIYALAEDSSGNVWAGTYKGLDKITQNPQNNQIDVTRFGHKPQSQNSLSHPFVWSLYIDKNQTIWIGTSGGGLNRFDQKSQNFIHYRHGLSDPNSISGNTIMSIFEDSKGLLWLGTFSGGINKLNRRRQDFSHFKHLPDEPGSLNDNRVKAIFKDQQGILWIGTDTGLNRYHKDTKRFTRYEHQADKASSIPQRGIFAIFQDSHGKFWIGTNGYGLWTLNKNTGQFSPYKKITHSADDSVGGWIQIIHEDTSGVLWVGSTLGLHRYDRQTGLFETIELFNQANPKATMGRGIYTITSDKSGKIWIGTKNSGLIQYDPKSKRTLFYINSTTDLLPYNTIYALHKTAGNVLWLGTEFGLIKFDINSGKYQLYDEKDGLANNRVQDIMIDNQHQLWLSTNKGLTRFNPNSTNPQQSAFKTYTSNDGLQSNEFSTNSSFKSKEGELFFGGINGFNRFYPENISQDTQAPDIVLTDFLLDNKSVPVGSVNNIKPTRFTLTKNINSVKHITLDHHQNLLTFEFAALHFTDPMRNQYAYKLQGLDSNWIYTDAKHRR